MDEPVIETLLGCEKPVKTEKPEEVVFPLFPDPTDDDFESDIAEEERKHYVSLIPDLNTVKTSRLHCTACDRHIGCSAQKDTRMRPHPMLRTLVCQTCHTFYNSGEFDKGDDGSELYCRWCGQGGQVYCCSECPHVFCAKCIKRNFGPSKIKEIENTDDWKCFKCNPKCLWGLRATCWALLRYVDLKNKIAYQTEDPELKESYLKDCAIDHSECCKNKARRQKTDIAKKKEAENSAKKIVIPKLPPTIQVKKFASINNDESPKQEKKAIKRPASPKTKPNVLKNPIAISQCHRLITPLAPSFKKMKMLPRPLINPVRYLSDQRSPTTYNMSFPRIRPRMPIYQLPMALPAANSNFNGFSHIGNNSGNFNQQIISNDNINLSIESLTQGLDMAAVTALNNNNNDDVVCTPDFPLEPLCEVTEDNDDDVECITPGPARAPSPPPLVPVNRAGPKPDLSSENIIQMTENDVSVNATTGGLKFRVDPQTLSSNKMYRLPDGRIFAINVNANMPGGYSATIVAVTEAGKGAVKGGTFAAKVSAVSPAAASSARRARARPRARSTRAAAKRTPKAKEAKAGAERQCDMKVPVEWFRYNLLDAVDSLEYSMTRLQKLKKETSSQFLRSRNVEEMRKLHRTLERLLNTSARRFTEIRDNLTADLKKFVGRKENGAVSEDDEDDDDDVEILPNQEDEDPIFIDENSTDSANLTESQEVDLTGAGSSEYNDSLENKDDPINLDAQNESPVLSTHRLENEETITGDKNDVEDDGAAPGDDEVESVNKTAKDFLIGDETDNATASDISSVKQDSENKEKNIDDKPTVPKVSAENDKKSDQEDVNTDSAKDVDMLSDAENGPSDSDKSAEIDDNTPEDSEKPNEDNLNVENQDTDDKMQDVEMSDEMIETLLKDDNTGDDVNDVANLNSLELPAVQDT